MSRAHSVPQNPKYFSSRPTNAGNTAFPIQKDDSSSSSSDDGTDKLHQHSATHRTKKARQVGRCGCSSCGADCVCDNCSGTHAPCGSCANCKDCMKACQCERCGRQCPCDSCQPGQPCMCAQCQQTVNATGNVNGTPAVPRKGGLRAGI